MEEELMPNVIQEAEKPRKNRWVIYLLTALLAVVILYSINQLFNNTKLSTITPPIDFTQPMFEEKEGRFYMQGVTIGDTKEKIVALFGENALKEYEEDGSGADYILDYNGDARFYFYEGKLFLMILLNTNEEAFTHLYDTYSGHKFTTDGGRFFYTTETLPVLKAEYTPMGTLSVYLRTSSSGEFRDMLEYVITQGE